MRSKTDLLGMHHIAIYVRNLKECVEFYCDLIGMHVEWNPDPDNFYLSSGTDNLALHKLPESQVMQTPLDHIGFVLRTEQAVDEWYNYLTAQKVPMRTKPKTHRDGARSFYCEDPDGNVVQLIYHPPIVKAFTVLS